MTASIWTRASLAQLLEEVKRYEELVPDREYSLLGVKWYAKGVFERERKLGSQIKAKKLNRIERGDFTYNRLFAWKGSFAIAEDDQAGGFVSGEFPLFRPSSDALSIPFLMHYFSQPSVWELIDHESVGTASVSRKRWKQERFLEWKINLPPLPEQRKIAAIISSVDDVIEKTEAVIEQLQVVKKAMMQELLTRGLPGRHTRFKQTEIGEIPEEREVVLLDTIARRGSGHTPDKKHPEYWDGEVKWVSLKDSSQLDQLYISDTAAKITPEGIANSSAVEHPSGTVVLSRDAGVGKSAITTDVMAVSQHFMAWRCGPKLDNHFLYYWLQSMKTEFERIAIGSTIKTIGLSYFKQLRVPLPPLNEQQSVAETLVATDRRIFSEEAEVRELQALKSALLSVLLTGEVRVTPDEEAA